MTYVDGMMVAVPTDAKADYLDHARRASVLFKGEGALSVIECWGDDVPDGEVNSLKSAVLLKEGETVVMSWITWPSKEVRDQAWGTLMSNGALEGLGPMPFDGARMISGGFEQILSD